MKVEGDYYADNIVKTEDLEEQSLVVGSSGKGKTLLLERLIWSYYKKGWHIIIASDAKRLLELAFMGFPTTIMADYHLRALRQQGEKPTPIPVKLFHPFTFDIPHNELPDYNIVTFPIKAMSDEEFDFLIESADDRTTRELLIQAREELKPEEGLWHYMKRIEALTERKTAKHGATEVRLPDPNRFCLRGVSAGGIINLDGIERAFSRFRRHLFLGPENSKLNLDWKNQVFSNQEEIKVFTTRHIKNDRKSSHFFTLMLLNQLVEHAHLSKKKILLVLDEVKDLLPRQAKGYEGILAGSIARALNTSFRARGIGSVSTSQSFAGINRRLVAENVWTNTFIMYLDSLDDLKILREVYGFQSGMVDRIQTLSHNQHYARGIKKMHMRNVYAPHTALLAPFPHAEPQMQFDNLFRRFFKNRVRKYEDLLREQREQVADWKKHFMDQAREELKAEKEQEQALTREKERRKQLEQQLETRRDVAKQSKEQEREERDELILGRYKEGISQRAIAKEFGLSQPGVRDILIRKGVL